MQDIYSFLTGLFAYLANLFAMPGVRSAAVGILLFFVAGVTYFRAIRSHAGYQGTGASVGRMVDDDRQRLLDSWSVPEDAQIRWDITAARRDIAHLDAVLMLIHATLRSILAVLMIGVLLMVF